MVILTMILSAISGYIANQTLYEPSMQLGPRSGAMARNVIGGVLMLTFIPLVYFSLGGRRVGLVLASTATALAGVAIGSGAGHWKSHVKEYDNRD